MKDIFDILSEWYELVLCAKNEYVFDEPIDKELFKTCMKDAFEYFFISGEKKGKDFSSEEISLYGDIYAYSQMPAVVEGENTTVFKASLHAAGALAESIIRPIYTIENYTLIEGKYMLGEFTDDGIVADSEAVEAKYNFETGDLSDYIKLVEAGILD